MFQDGIVARAVDDVAAAGVAYFSSAGNRPATQGYDASFRPVAADDATLAGSGLDFSAVNPALYAGGFHNFAGSGGLDIAQTVALSGSSTLVFQWNEPFDPVPPTVIQNLGYGFGSISVDEPYVFLPFEGEAGMTVRIYADGDDYYGTPNPDVMIYLLDANFEVVAFRDATTNPETLYAELGATGTYYAVIAGYDDAVGDIYCQVDEVEIPEIVLTDFNVLLFTADGAYLGALAEENRITNRPIELGGLNVGNATVPIQVVIARANVPEATSRRMRSADHLRCVWFGSGVPQEYFSYLDSVTYGHSAARGSNSVAAYAFYPPFIPESFTSPGHATIYFDQDNRRLRRPEIRLKPDIAAMDGANNTFFGGGDSSQDPDTLPNFFGTSAAAPHAAAIGALMLQVAGGPGSLKPDRVADLLKQSTFPHDLDPHFAFGLARTRRGGLIGVSATADANSISQFDPQVFAVANYGFGALARIEFDLSGGNPTETPRGMVFDERSGGPGQPFILGSLDGLEPGDVTPVLSGPADAPGVAGQWKKLTLNFTPGSFTWCDSIGFGIDRDEADAYGPSGAVSGNSADLLGGGVLIPQGTLTGGGAAFSGALENGETFSGRFINLIGSGYSRLDGYGFVNAEEAVRLAQKRRPGRR
ncbi:MAG: S8 family serine peptidase [Opitutaceae bacterium]|nr:S8 family serine peptidase [Opitutaceae bacterium]